MLRPLIILAAGLSLASCVSVLPQPKSANALYRLEPAIASQTVSSTILVREPEAPRTFAGRAIAAEGSDGSIRYVPGVEWADNITRLLQLALLDTLQGRDGAAVLAYETAVSGAFELSWRLSDFVLSGDQARCELDVTILDARSRTPLAQKRITSEISVGGHDNPSRARALAEAGRMCVSEAASFAAQMVDAETGPADG